MVSPHCELHNDTWEYQDLKKDAEQATHLRGYSILGFLLRSTPSSEQNTHVNGFSPLWVSQWHLETLRFKKKKLEKLKYKGLFNKRISIKVTITFWTYHTFERFLPTVIVVMPLKIPKRSRNNSCLNGPSTPEYPLRSLEVKQVKCIQH